MKCDVLQYTRTDSGFPVRFKTFGKEDSPNRNYVNQHRCMEHSDKIKQHVQFLFLSKKV